MSDLPGAPTGAPVARPHGPPGRQVPGLMAHRGAVCPASWPTGAPGVRPHGPGARPHGPPGGRVTGLMAHRDAKRLVPAPGEPKGSPKDTPGIPRQPQGTTKAPQRTSQAPQKRPQGIPKGGIWDFIPAHVGIRQPLPVRGDQAVGVEFESSSNLLRILGAGHTRGFCCCR